MSYMNMQYLRTFLVMVEQKSSTKTARSQDISQESVRHQIGQLEETVGKCLLERAVPPKPGEAGRTQLTEEGHAFLPRAIEAMRAHDRMFDDNFVDLDPRMMAGVLATLLLEIAEDVVKGELSEEDTDRIRKTLKVRDRGGASRRAAEVLVPVLQETALAALKHDLSEDERDRLHAVLSGVRADA